VIRNNPSSHCTRNRHLLETGASTLYSRGRTSSVLQGIPPGDGPVPLFDLTLRAREVGRHVLRACGIQTGTAPSLTGGHSLDKLRMRGHGPTGSITMAHEQIGILAFKLYKGCRQPSGLSDTPRTPVYHGNPVSLPMAPFSGAYHGTGLVQTSNLVPPMSIRA